MNKIILETILKQLLSFNDDILFDKSNQSKIVDKNVKYSLWLNEMFVDLGLPSGTLWAKHNLGANPNYNELITDSYKSWYGNYYMPFIKYPVDFKNKLFLNLYAKYSADDSLFERYNKIPNKLNPVKYDVHYINTDATLPSELDFKELLEYTNHEYILGYLGVSASRLHGLLFTSKINNATLFLPCAGYMKPILLNNDGRQCFYLTSDIGSDSISSYTSEYGSIVFKSFMESWVKTNIYVGMETGFSVRPVIKL